MTYSELSQQIEEAIGRGDDQAVIALGRQHYRLLVEAMNNGLLPNDSPFMRWCVTKVGVLFMVMQMPTLIEQIKNRKPGEKLPDLQGASLQRADLHGANLYGANLHWANLYGANLRGANLREAKFDDNTILDTGETWAEYLREVVPVIQVMLAFEGEVILLLRPRYLQFLILKEVNLFSETMARILDKGS